MDEGEGGLSQTNALGAGNRRWTNAMPANDVAEWGFSLLPVTLFGGICWA
jgi:hypothetical protein